MYKALYKDTHREAAMARYQHCIFDLYGTLVDIHTEETRPKLWREMSAWYREHGADYRPGALRDAYFRTVRLLEGADPLRNDAHEAHPEIRIEEVFQRLFQEKGVDADLALAIQTGERFRTASLIHLRLYDGAVKLLETLRAHGQRVWLLSNAQRVFTMSELRSLGIEGLFDGIYLSSDYGCKKPDPRFFGLLLQERGIDPESAIMIGNDGVCDIQGAKGVGLSTLYIRSNISPDEPLPEADYVLEEMNLHRVRDILTQGVKLP